MSYVFFSRHTATAAVKLRKIIFSTQQKEKYQGVKNFTLVARMQNSISILRETDESSMF